MAKLFCHSGLRLDAIIIWLRYKLANLLSHAAHFGYHNGIRCAFYHSSRISQTTQITANIRNERYFQRKDKLVKIEFKWPKTFRQCSTAIFFLL